MSYDPKAGGLRYNPLSDGDSYKDVHSFVYPDDVNQLFSYFESRGGDYPASLFFGAQGYVRHLAENPITAQDIDDEEDFSRSHGTAFNREGWERVLNEYGGYAPIEIRSADEGLLIPTRNVLTTVCSEPGFEFVTSYHETSFLAHLWPSMTVATRIFHMKQKLAPLFEKTSDDEKVSPFAVLNFAARGSKGRDDVRLTGAAHLAMFTGTDSKLAVRYTNYYYDSIMSGFSVWATEHSVMCAWGSDGVDTLRALLAKAVAKDAKILSIVGDTWNIFTFAKAAASMAKEFQDAGVLFVCRPDSGTPAEVLPEILHTLAGGFGTTTNRKGYAVLNGAKVLWADGVDENTFLEPFVIAINLGFSADNIMVGSGGGLVQKGLDRDTLKCAFKASALRRFGSDAWEGIAKDPITDSGKRSKLGRQSLIRLPSGYSTVSIQSSGGMEFPTESHNLLKVRYKNGELFNPTTIDEIRERVDREIYQPNWMADESARIQGRHHA